MTKLLLSLLFLMCENVNAAPQAHVNAGDGIDASSQASSKPTVAAPFTLSHPLCTTGFVLAQRFDTRDRFGIITKRQWKMTDCVRVPRIVYGRKV